MEDEPANRISRHQFLKIVAGGAIGVTTSTHRLCPAARPTTRVYKTAGKCQIKADVHQTAPGYRKPAVMWIHGGALIMGSRKGLDGRFHAELATGIRGRVDRLPPAPETKLPGIIEDVQDAWRWLRQEGPKQFGIDPDRIATAGGSAGGYLTLMTGFCLEPRPRALVSYFGYGDITTPWYSNPDAFYRRQPLVSKEEAYRAWAAACCRSRPSPNQRGRFYLYCRQNGIWPNEVAGHDPHAEPSGSTRIVRFATSRPSIRPRC